MASSNRMRTAARGVGAVALAAALGALAPGCGDDDAGVGYDEGDDGTLSVLVEPSEVGPGESVRARVQNDGEKTFTYGAAYGLEREVEGEFEAVEQPREPIKQIGHVAPPGEAGPPIVVNVPDDATPGNWRVVIPVTPGKPELTGEFTVTDG